MSTIDIDSWELHNLVRVGGSLRTRKGVVLHEEPTSGTHFVAGFSIESPFTTEVWHYLFEQNDTTNEVTVRCKTEEYVEMWSLSLGALQKDPIITYGVQNNQIMVNSPAFSTPLYGLPGGGLITAVKTESVNDDTTALELPAGHIAVFGDRFAIAQGNVVFFNDPGIDPRTFVAENVVALPGTILDLFQGPEGALYIATTQGLYTLPSDALGQGQAVQGFLSRVPGIELIRSRNAAAGAGAVAVLQRDHVLVLPGTRIEAAPHKGRRYFSQVVEVDDLRRSGELFAVPGGFLVGFRGARGHYLHIDLATSGVSHISSNASGFNLVGTLRSRDGMPLLVVPNAVLEHFTRSPEDPWDDGAIIGVASGRSPLPPGQSGVVRRVTVSSDNASQAVGSFVDGNADTGTSPVKDADLVIGTALWAASGSFAGRTMRTTRLSHAVRSTAPSIEVKFNGGDVEVAPRIDLEINGQGKARRDAS